jgi:F-type H+-transporting ATPase subunit epsilon
MATLQCTVVTPEGAILDLAADSVVVPAWDGEVGFLPGHARFLAKLGIGLLRVTHEGRTEQMLVEGGFVQVADDRVTVLTDTATHPSQINLREAEWSLDEIRGKGNGEEFAAAKNRVLTMKRVKDRFNRS